MNVWKLTYKNAPVLNNNIKLFEFEVSLNPNKFDKTKVNQAPIGADIENKNKWNIIIFFLIFDLKE